MSTDETPGPESSSNGSKPFYKRWWFIALAVVVILGAIFNLGEDEEGDPTAATTTTSPVVQTTALAEQSTSTTERSPSTTATEPTTTTTVAPTSTVPPTTTTTEPPWDTFATEGNGDDFIEFSIPNHDAAVLEISHTGSSNFAVLSYTDSNERLDLLVNEIGDYQGRVPVNFLVGEDVGLLEITASGSWSITALPLTDLEITSDASTGTGDDVVVMDVSSPSLEVTHDGESNFVVMAWTDGRDLLVNEIGAYDGTVRSPTGFVIYAINADGNWALTAG